MNRLCLLVTCSLLVGAVTAKKTKQTTFEIVSGWKEKGFNITHAVGVGAISETTCATRCLRQNWCRTVTFFAGFNTDKNCFLSCGAAGELEEDASAVLMKKQTPALKNARDCKDLMDAGFGNDDVYTINPGGSREVNVACDMTADDGGWTIFQQRSNGLVDFYRNWTEYVEGFGSKSMYGGEYWLGLEAIHQLTNMGFTELYVKLTSADGEDRYAKYSNFALGNAASLYAITTTWDEGTAGDSLLYQEGRAFSTYDNEHTATSCNACSIRFHGAWWYNCCHFSNLNGAYINSVSASFGQGMQWRTSFGLYHSVRSTTMMLRRK